MRLAAFRFPLAAVIFAGALAGCASVLPRYSKQRDVVYTPAGWPERIKADLFVPQGPGPFPAVLLIHGGSWSAPDDRWRMAGIAEKLANHGYVVMNATYRFAPQYKYPAQIEDLTEAVKWLRAHAAEYRVDSARIATWGFSAGGQLAAQLGMIGAGSASIQAVVVESAPTDLVFGAPSPILEYYLGGTLEQIPEIYRDASPVYHVSPRSPPVFQSHGTADTTVSPDHTRRFKAALDAAGVMNEVFWVEGRGHAGAFLFDHGAEEAAIAFLDRVM